MTWLPVESDAPAERDAVLGLRAEAYARLRDMLVLAWQITDARLLELCRLRFAQLLDARAELAGADAQLLADLAAWESSERFSDRERAALSYAEQFHYDHNGLSDEQKHDLGRHLSRRETFNFVQAVYVNNSYIRLLSLLDIAPDPSSTPPRPERDALAANLASPRREAEHAEADENDLLRSLTDPDYFEAREEFNRTVVRRSLVDDLTSEATRLRNANHQGCRYCGSVRRVTEWSDDAGDLMDQVLRYERSTSLTESHKVALRLTDAYLADPSGFGAEARAQTLEHFSPAQIVEILLKLACNTTNKAMIALGVDEPLDEERLTPFHYDANGEYIVHLAHV